MSDINNQPKRNRRWRLVADVRLQGLLSARVVVYWLVCQLAMVGTMLAFACLFDSSAPVSNGSIWSLLIPALTVSTLLLPIVLFDLLIFSNRFAGPMVNFRKKFKQLADNHPSHPMRFREGDFFPELREDFNRIHQSRVLRPTRAAAGVPKR